MTLLWFGGFFIGLAVGMVIGWKYGKVEYNPGTGLSWFKEEEKGAIIHTDRQELFNKAQHLDDILQ